MEHCFSNSFDQKAIQQPDGSCNVTCETLFLDKKVKIQSFNSANTYESYIVSKENCIAHHNDNMCFLFNSRYHNTIIRVIKTFLEKLDAVVFKRQHVDSLCILLKYRISDKNVAKSGQMFGHVQRAVYSVQRTNIEGKMPSITKKSLLWKKYQKHRMTCLQKTKSTQTSG